MEASTTTLRAPAAVALARLDLAGLAVWLLPAILIPYLALSNGGYDVIERSEVGIAVWWLVGLGTLVGALQAAGGTRTGRVLLGVLATFAVWTALSLSWTESAERTAIELGRIATYLGVFALALAVQGAGRWRVLLNGVTFGLAAVITIAVLARLEPTWFPDRDTGEFLRGIEIESRLAYPLNYSTGLGALAAITLPLLLSATSSARTVVGQSLAAAALPMAALALWLTTSSLAVPAALIGIGTFLALTPDRLQKLVSLLIAGLGAALLIAALGQRAALDRGLPTPSALEQGDEMLAVVLVVCTGVALLQAGVSLVARFMRRAFWFEVSRPTAAASLAALCVLGLAVALVAGLPGKVADEWETFTGRGDTTPFEDSRGEQLVDFSSSGRYQLWEAAIDAGESEPLLGIGPGTYEFWWARNGSGPGFVRDAHSLFAETFAELGLVGLLLISGFAVAVLAIGATRSLRAPPDLRLGLAAATAGSAAFITAAAFDWMWELAVLPVAFLLLAAIATAGGEDPIRSRGRWAPAALAVAAILAISLPLAGTTALEQSRADASAGDLDAALAEAREAASLQPYAASPQLQEALLLERRGEFERATQAAEEATRSESTNFRAWLILARAEALSGDPEAAVRAYREAASLTDVRALDAAAGVAPGDEEAGAADGAEPARAEPERTVPPAVRMRQKLKQAIGRERKGDLEGAIALTREAARIDPDNPTPWRLLARLEFRSGDRAAALEAVQKARSLSAEPGARK